MLWAIFTERVSLFFPLLLFFLQAKVFSNGITTTNVLDGAANGTPEIACQQGTLKNKKLFNYINCKNNSLNQ